MALNELVKMEASGQPSFIPTYTNVTSAKMAQQLEEKFSLFQRHLYIDSEVRENIKVNVTAKEDCVDVDLEDLEGYTLSAVQIKSQGKDGIVRDVTVQPRVFPSGYCGGIEVNIDSEKYHIR